MTQRMLYPMQEAVEVSGLNRTRLYGFIRTGELETVVVGRRRLVPHDALEDLVARLRTAQAAS